MAKKKRYYLHVEIPPEMEEQIKARAAAEGRDLKVVVQRMLAQALAMSAATP